MTDEEEQRVDHTESRGTDVHDDDVIRDVDYSTVGGPSQPQSDTVTESTPPKGIAVTRVPLLGDGAVIKAEEYQRLWTTFTERSSELLMELKEAPTSIAVLETALVAHKVRTIASGDLPPPQRGFKLFVYAYTAPNFNSTIPVSSAERNDRGNVIVLGQLVVTTDTNEVRLVVKGPPPASASTSEDPDLRLVVQHALSQL
eukprot:gene6389-8157_t